MDVHNLLSYSLQTAESKIMNYEQEISTLKRKIEMLVGMVESFNATAQRFEREARILEEQEVYLVEKHQSEFSTIREVEERCKSSENEAKRATELVVDEARAEAVSAQKEKNETQRNAMESSAQIERTEWLMSSGRQELVLKHVPEMDELSKVAMVERRLGERLEVIESKLKSNNEQNMVQVLEKLLESERRARTEALSVLLEASQGKCDMLVQELVAIRQNETALEGKLRTAFHGKRVRNYEMGMESIHDIGTNEEVSRGNKRCKNTNSPLKSILLKMVVRYIGVGLKPKARGPTLRTIQSSQLIETGTRVEET